MKNAYRSLLVFVVLSVVGLALLPKLSVQLNPSTNGANLTVSYDWPNASPEAVERQVTTSLEGMFSMLRGIKKVKSLSGYHYGYITLEADKNADLDQLRFEVSALIRQVYGRLPKEVSYPTLTLNIPEQEAEQKPLMTLQLNGTASATDLQRYAEEQLKPRLAAVDGLYEVQVLGGNRDEYMLTYSPDQLQNLNIKESELVAAIRQQLSKQSLGTARLSNGRELRVSLQSQTLERFRTFPTFTTLFHIPIKNQNGRLIYLTDLVKISRQPQPARSYYRINGQNAITLVVRAEANTNQLNAASNTHLAIAQLQAQLPNGYQLRVEYDSTEYIRENLQQIAIQSGLAVLLLLLFVLITSRSWRYTLLIFSSLIVNLALSVILFYIFKVEIHLYSLAALTTSLGIVIDNVIVMIDHYRCYRDRSVFIALLGATLTTCAGLVVIWFLPEQTRIDLWDFALVMMLTLAVSLAVALWFVPAWIEKAQAPNPEGESKLKIRSRFLVKANQIYFWIILRLLRFRKTIFVLGVLAFGLPVFMLPNRIDDKYRFSEYYNLLIGSELYQETLKSYIDKGLGGTLRLFVNYVYEQSYYSKNERTSLYIIANLPNNSTIKQMDSLFIRFENQLNVYPEIARFVTNIQSGQQGSLVIYFTKKAEESSFPYILKNRMIALSTESSGVDWDIYGVGQGFSQHLNDNSTPTFNVSMYGYNYLELERQAQILKTKLETHPRIKEVDINRSVGIFSQKNLYEYALTAKPEELALQNLSFDELYQQTQDRNILSQADLYLMIGEQYEPIKLVPAHYQDFDIWQLAHQPWQKDSLRFKLNTAQIVRQKVIPEIQKEDQQYLRRVSFDYFGSQRFGEQFLEEKLIEMKKILPLGYKAEQANYNWFQNDVKQQYWLIGLVALLIYVICAIIFESLTQPLALIMLIPLSFIGVFLTFYWFDFNFDQGGYASFVLLSGNVVCAGIFIIAEYNRLQKRLPNASSIRLYLKAYHHKIVPILLTVLSTVVGLVPFLIFGQNEPFWFALGAGTIGGLLMSLVMIWFFLPLMVVKKVTYCPTFFTTINGCIRRLERFDCGQVSITDGLD
jgi:multidrug efflux pump subunit AcrB